MLSPSPAVHICPMSSTTSQLSRQQAWWPAHLPTMHTANTHLWSCLPHTDEGGQCTGPTLLERKVTAWMILEDHSTISHSCRETFWIVGRWPPKHQRTCPSREGVPSMESPLWTQCLATCKQLLFSAKVSPALPHHLERTYGQVLQSQMPHKSISPRSSLLLGKALGCACSYSIHRRSFLIYVCPGTFPLKEFFPAVWKNSKGRHLSSIFRGSCPYVSSWYCFIKETSCWK